MEIYNNELKTEIHTMFQELTVKAKEIKVNFKTAQIAIERIIEAVSSRVAAESEGYIIDIYNFLVTKIKADEYFQDPDYLNSFYRLNLREKLNDKYHFEVKSLDAYKIGIEFKEVNKLYAAIRAIAGTLVVGCILKFAISEFINIPVPIIIICTIIIGVIAYFSVSKK